MNLNLGIRVNTIMNACVVELRYTFYNWMGSFIEVILPFQFHLLVYEYALTWFSKKHIRTIRKGLWNVVEIMMNTIQQHVEWSRKYLTANQAAGLNVTIWITQYRFSWAARATILGEGRSFGYSLNFYFFAYKLRYGVWDFDFPHTHFSKPQSINHTRQSATAYIHTCM